MTITDLKTSIAHWLRDFNQPLFQNLEGNTDISVSQRDSRDDTFDVLKGIAIILMILGHCNVGPLHGFIFTFHKPLLFCDRLFFKDTAFAYRNRHEPKTPNNPLYFFCILLIISFLDFADKGWIDIACLKDNSLRFLLVFKGGTAPEWLHGEIRALWFFLALF